MIDLQRVTASGRPYALALLSCALIGCASHPDKIGTAYVSTLKYETSSCAQIAAEMAAVESRTGVLYQELRDTRRTDNWQAGVGILLLPVTLFALEGGDGVEASEYAFLKGDYEALRHASMQKRCGLQARSPAEQITDSLLADTQIALPNNTRVSLSQMLGMLERAHSQGVISDAQLNEARDTAFRLLGSDTQQPSSEALDSLYAIINKTDLGLLVHVDNPIAAPAGRQIPRQQSPAQAAVAQFSAGPTNRALTQPIAPMSDNDGGATRPASPAHSPDVQASPGSVASILHDYRHVESLEVDQLPQWKLIRFLERAGLPSDTPALAFIDTSVFRSGKNGVLFAEQGLHYTNDFVAGAGGSFFISYEEIVAQASPIHRGRYFYLGYDILPKRGLIDFVGADTDLEEFSALIAAIKTRYEAPQDYFADIDEPVFHPAF